MPIGTPRRRKKTVKKREILGIHAAAKKARAEQRAEAERADWEDLLLSDRAAKRALSKISQNSAEGFQAPRSSYDLGDQLRDLYELIVPMTKEGRITLLKELAAIYPRRKGASRYHALVRAGSIRGYNNAKVISHRARRLEDAIKAKVPLEEFDSFRKR